MQQSVEGLIKLADLKGTEKVLDVAAGTGFSSKFLLSAIPNGDLTVLERSPRMLYASMRALGDNSRLHYALCPLPNPNGGDIDIRGNRYDLIFCHLAIFAIARDHYELKSFALWCAKHLTDGGRIVINVHNGVMKMKLPDGFEEWKDPVRNKLRSLAATKNLKLRLDSQWDISEEIMEDIFQEAGFSVSNKVYDEWPITMQDRYFLWNVPAIFDTCVAMEGMDIREAKEIVRNTFQSVEKQRTMPRSVISWVFSRP